MRLTPTLSGILFVLMCLIWGATWIAMKIGVEAVPPALFAGTRFLVAGLILMGTCAALGIGLKVERAVRGRLALASTMMVTVTYPLLFWGAQHVSTGLAAVIDLSFLPVALLAFGVVAGEERLDRGRILALALGAAGLALLFGRKVSVGGGSPLELSGCAAIVLSAVAYAAGSVLARPLLRAYPPTLVSAWTLFAGGVVTLAGAVLLEPGAREALALDWGAPAWVSWAFLVLGGSVAAYTIYLRLVRDWGPSRAGAYCFVSPIIAVALGVAFMGEKVGAAELLGMGAMLVAAWLAIREPDAPALKPQQEDSYGVPQGPADRSRASARA